MVAGVGGESPCSSFKWPSMRVPRLGLSPRERGVLGKVVLSSPLLNEILFHSEKPNCEICGALYGTFAEATVRLSHLYLCPNHSQSPSEFAIDIEEMAATWPPTGGARRRLVGVFHSHPRGEPTPSVYDLPFLRCSQMLWAISGRTPSSRSPEVRFFIHVDGVTKEVHQLVEQ